MIKKLLMILCICLLVGCSSSVMMEDVSLAELKEALENSEILGPAFDSGIAYLNPDLEVKEEELSEYLNFEGIRTSSTRIVVFEVKEEEYIEKYVEIAKEMRKRLITTFEHYLIGPREIAQASRIEQRGQYIIFVSHENEEHIWEIIDEYIDNTKANRVTSEE